MRRWTCTECRLVFDEPAAKNVHVRWHIRREMSERSRLWAELDRLKRRLDRWTDVWEPPK
jgi:hypothetical protein